MANIHVKGGAELQKFLQELPVKMERNVLRGAMRAGMAPIHEQVQATAPQATGELKRGLKVSTRASRGTVRATLKAGGKHGWLAYLFEYTGAAAHFIKPKKMKSLVIAGILRKVVLHPGFQPRPFMRPALQNRADAAVHAAASYIKLRLTTAGIEKASEVDV